MCEEYPHGKVVHYLLIFINSKIGDRIIRMTILPPMELIGSYMLWADDNKLRKIAGMTWKEFHAKQAETEAIRLKGQ